jgi:LPXTG-motif cell wall-anchored protein
VGATPLGYIEVDASGTRYVAIGGGTRERALTALVAAGAGLLGALAGVLLGRRRR